MGLPGQGDARHVLLLRVYEPMRQPTKQRLRSYPDLRSLDLADDVLHEAILRLCKVLAVLQPESDDHLYRLAAMQVTRAFLDGARKERLAQRVIEEAGQVNALKSLVDNELDPATLDEWTDFHRCVDLLPDDERNVVLLVWYDGLSGTKAASQLGVSVRTVRRRWRSACRLLADALKGWLEH